MSGEELTLYYILAYFAGAVGCLIAALLVLIAWRIKELNDFLSAPENQDIYNPDQEPISLPPVRPANVTNVAPPCVRTGANDKRKAGGGSHQTLT